jgi:curli biogenesis system outer membrane secretion channel CsgG
MTGKKDMVRDIEKALTHALARTKSGRFAVYVPEQVVLGTYDREDEARAMADRWAAKGVDAVVVDREA